MAHLEHFCTVTGSLHARPVAAAPAGMRVDFPFEGTATSPHWEGERPVSGIDYVTMRADGNMNLDLRAVIGEKRQSIGYTGTGVSIATSKTGARPRELIVFQASDGDFAWLNDEIAVGLGSVEDGVLSLEISIVKD